jgi:S-ribosylhomocysteine lyase
MDKIKSFTIDHNTHAPGFYLSGEANGIFTYDLRFKWPNKGDYLENGAMHTIEHLFATVIRNSQIKNKVVYFGPMGCRTGFYLLLLGIEKDEAQSETIKTLSDCLALDEIPGRDIKECGNYLEHSLEGAKKELGEYLKVLKKQK